VADVELLPLPEWTKRDDLGGLVPSEVRAEMQAYARANVAHANAAQAAEIEALRAEVELWRHKAAVHQYRRKRLAEALRDARRALAFASQHLPECNDPYERANRALAQEDSNG